MWSFFSREKNDFPYEIGDEVHGLESWSIWSLHRGRKKGAVADEVSIFVYDIKNGTEAKLELARASLKRLKTLRHPSILQYLDSVETDKVLYVATESVEPLGTHIEKLETDGPQKDLYLAWGIFQITVRRIKFQLSFPMAWVILCADGTEISHQHLRIFEYQNILFFPVKLILCQSLTQNLI